MTRTANQISTEILRFSQARFMGLLNKGFAVGPLLEVPGGGQIGNMHGGGIVFVWGHIHVVKPYGAIRYVVPHMPLE